MKLPGYYEFCCGVKIVAGHQALEKIPALLKELQSRKTMIITDKGVAGAGLIDVVTRSIQDKVAIGSIEDDVPPDSSLKVVNRLAEIYRTQGCDSILAVGGGSVMDTAKGVNIVVSEDAEDLMQFSGAGKLKRPLKPLIAIPTTAGTGSEVTLVAVIADHDRNLKMAFASYFLLPNAAVLDSRMTMTLPPFITSATGMDALSHAIEGYTCMAKNPLSDAHGMAAVSLIFKHLLNVVKNPGNQDGRLALANAATLAGIAFSNSMVGMVHTIGHSIGGVCHVPHGTCMAILLPYGLEYNLHRNEEITAELLLAAAGSEVYNATPRTWRAEKVIELVRKLNQDLYEATDGKHARFLKEVLDRDGNPMVPKEKIPEIAKTALGDGSLIYNPEDLDYDDLIMVIEAAWNGGSIDRSLIKKG